MLTEKVRSILNRFDALPDDAVLQSSTTSIITGLSERTIRYHPKLPRKYLTANRYGQRVGDVRRLIRGEPAP
jgi:hypothetical protein